MKVGGIRMKILFVGNSHTYMNDMPEMVRINSSEKLEVTMLARPFYSWKTQDGLD